MNFENGLCEECYEESLYDENWQCCDRCIDLRNQYRSSFEENPEVEEDNDYEDGCLIM